MYKVRFQIDKYNTDFIKRRICDICPVYIKDDTNWLSHNCKKECYVNEIFTKCANIFTPFNQTIHTSKDIDELAQKQKPIDIMDKIKEQHCHHTGLLGAKVKWCKEGFFPN